MVHAWVILKDFVTDPIIGATVIGQLKAVCDLDLTAAGSQRGEVHHG